MKIPKFGKNRIQSFFDYETTFGKVRVGIEANKLFIEIAEQKTFITDENRNIVGDILADVLTEKTAGAGITADGVLLKDGGIQLSTGIVQYSKTVTMSAAEIIAATAGGFAHANGLELVAGPGTGFVLELVSAVLVYDGDGSGYTDGGNVTINIGSGGAAITGLVSAANSFGASGDKIYRFVPLSVAALSLPVNTGINIVSSAAFTTAGAAGTAIVRLTYNVITTGL